MPDKLEIKLVEPAPAEDVFNDLEALRRTSTLKVTRKVLPVNVSVKRPANDRYFRCHPDPEMSLECSILINKDDRDTFYFISPYMLNHQVILPRLRKVTIAVVYTWPGGVVSLWPVPADESSRIACWKSARVAYELSKTQWVQLCWNDSTRDYDVATAEGINSEPMWPDDLNLQALLKLGFADKIISSPDHPYVQQLRGIAG